MNKDVVRDACAAVRYPDSCTKVEALGLLRSLLDEIHTDPDAVARARVEKFTYGTAVEQIREKAEHWASIQISEKDKDLVELVASKASARMLGNEILDVLRQLDANELHAGKPDFYAEWHEALNANSRLSGIVSRTREHCLREARMARVSADLYVEHEDVAGAERELALAEAHEEVVRLLDGGTR